MAAPFGCTHLTGSLGARRIVTDQTPIRMFKPSTNCTTRYPADRSACDHIENPTPDQRDMERARPIGSAVLGA